MSSISAIYAATLKAHEQLLAHVIRTSSVMGPLYSTVVYEDATPTQLAELSDAEAQSFKTVVDCLFSYLEEVEQHLKCYATEPLAKNINLTGLTQKVSSPGGISAIIQLPSLFLAEFVCNAVVHSMPVENHDVPSIIICLCQVMSAIKRTESLLGSAPSEVAVIPATHARDLSLLSKKIEDLRPLCQEAIQQCSKMLYVYAGRSLGAPFDALHATVRKQISDQITSIATELNNTLNSVPTPLVL